MSEICPGCGKPEPREWCWDGPRGALGCPMGKPARYPVAKSPIRISCCICLNTGSRVSASTIVKGYAVCDAHVELVSEPDFDIFSLIRPRRVF